MWFLIDNFPRQYLQWDVARRSPHQTVGVNEKNEAHNVVLTAATQLSAEQATHVVAP